jgi:hypothetical protein
LARNSADGDHLLASGFPGITDDAVPTMIQFGALPPMIVFKHGDKVYMHQAQEPA